MDVIFRGFLVDTPNAREEMRVALELAMCCYVRTHDGPNGEPCTLRSAVCFHKKRKKKGKDGINQHLGRAAVRIPVDVRCFYDEAGNLVIQRVEPKEPTAKP